MPAESLTSAKNALLREVKRAAARGELTPEGSAVAEGIHLLEEAIRSRCEIEAVLVSESAQAILETRIRNLNGARLIVVPDKLFREIATTESSQGVITLVKPPRWTIDQLFDGQALVAVLDGVQDPGNAGTILRTAEAFGATGAMLVKGTVSPWNPKTLRASAGSLFRLPMICGLDGVQASELLAEKQLNVYAADPRGKTILPEADLTHPFAIAIGSEGHGVGETLRAGAVELRIPAVNVESLNAATAAAIVLYEASRQRAGKGLEIR